MSENWSIKEDFCCSVTEIQVLLFILSYASLDFSCLFMADTVYSFIHHLRKSFSNSVCKCSVHLYTTLNCTSEFWNFVWVLVRSRLSLLILQFPSVLWLDLFLLLLLLSKSKNQSSHWGDFSCSEELENKAFGLS